MKAKNVFSREARNMLLNLRQQHVGLRRAYRGVQLARGAVALGAIQKRSELAAFLAVVLERPPQTVVEIGLGGGGMLWALCQAAAPDATIVSIDLPGGPYGGHISETVVHDRLRAYAGENQTIHFIQASSFDPLTVETVRSLVRSVDLLFIDGDHTYDGVAADYRLYAPLVTQGGMVAFHDILPVDNLPECQVAKLWAQLHGDKIAITSPSELHGYFGGRWGGIGVLRLTRPQVL